MAAVEQMVAFQVLKNQAPGGDEQLRVLGKAEFWGEVCRVVVILIFVLPESSEVQKVEKRFIRLNL